MKNKENAEKKPKNFKKFKYGSMSVVVIVLVVAIVVVINVIAGVLMNRYPLKIDLTADQRYELSDETIQVLKEMDKDVEITVTYPEETLLQYSYYQMIPEILERYSIYAKAGDGSITVNYIDINQDPDLIAKYKQYYSGDISQGNIIIYSEERVKVTTISLFSQSSSGTITFTGESTLTSAIMSVIDANPISTAFMSTMGDSYIYGSDYSTYYCIETYKDLLSSNGYDCTDIDALSADISPDDYDLIVIPAPAYDLSEDVISALEDFLYNDGNYGKNIIYIANVYATGLTNLDEFLAKWNIQVENNIIFDDTNTMNASLYINSGATFSSPILTIADSDAVGTLPNESLPTVAPLSRELTILDKNSEYVTSSVLTSSNTSYVISIDEDSEASDEQSARNVAVLSKRERAEQYDVYTSSVLAIGAAYMADPTLIDNTNTYNNANLLLNMANTLTGKESSFVIPDKELQEETLALDSSQLKAIRTVVIYVIPLVVVAIGVVVFIRRKNR
ncbi:MAG: GldG family protein [Ruminococcus sp.]|nr:GldG family protein [Ruminococcus sp.]